MKFKSLLAVFLTFLIWQPAISFADTITYANPKHRTGIALDWCKVFAGQCGKPAADAFCRSKGHIKASAWPKRNHPGVKTMTFSQNAVCDPRYHRCDTFAKITCVKKPKPKKLFSAPKYRGYFLDWCRVFEGQCGKPAAKAFCQSKGYRTVFNYKKRNHAPGKTMTIAQNAVCDPRHHRCDTFKWIRCTK